MGYVKLNTLRTIAATICLLLIVSIARAEEARFFTHTAQAGDTLLKLANRYLVNRNDWQIFQKFNKVKNPRAIPLGAQIKIPVSAMRQDAAAAEVIATTGSVASSAGPVATGSKVGEGDKLTTGEGGFVTIKLADGSTLTVQPKSTIRMEAARQLVNTGGVTDTVVRLDSGRLETKVALQKNSAGRYEIRTPTSNMGVRGTLFRVGADESGQRGQGEVVEGLIAVSSPSPIAAPASKNLAPLALGAGFGSFVEAGKPPSPPIALLSAPEVSMLPAEMQTPDVRFSFSAVPGALSYRAQVARDNAFTNLIASASSTSPDVAFVNLPDGALFVRVRGVDVNGLEGKDAARAFSVKARPLPPLLSEPGDASRILTSVVTLRWEEAVDAVSYRVQLASDAAFTTPLFDDKGVARTSLTPTIVLKPETTHWRVASTNAKGESGPWSPSRSFIGAADLPVLNAKRAAGAMPLEIDASSAQAHQVQIARDPRFTNIASDRTIVGSKFDLGSLPTNVYYIRVRAMDKTVNGSEKLAGPWSEPRMLEVYPFGGGWWLSVSNAPAATSAPPANR